MLNRHVTLGLGNPKNGESLRNVLQTDVGKAWPPGGRLPGGYKEIGRQVVVTVLFSRGARVGFEGVIEGEEEFSHDRGESQFGRFAFGAQTLIKV
jgi:hypothetical protein